MMWNGHIFLKIKTRDDSGIAIHATDEWCLRIETNQLRSRMGNAVLPFHYVCGWDGVSDFFRFLQAVQSHDSTCGLLMLNLHRKGACGGSRYAYMHISLNTYIYIHHATRILDCKGKKRAWLIYMASTRSTNLTIIPAGLTGGGKIEKGTAWSMRSRRMKYKVVERWRGLSLELASLVPFIVVLTLYSFSLVNFNLLLLHASFLTGTLYFTFYCHGSSPTYSQHIFLKLLTADDFPCLALASSVSCARTPSISLLR